MIQFPPSPWSAAGRKPPRRPQGPKQPGSPPPVGPVGGNKPLPNYTKARLISTFLRIVRQRTSPHSQNLTEWIMHELGRNTGQIARPSDDRDMGCVVISLEDLDQEKIRGSAPDSPEGQLLQAEEKLQRGETETAREILERVLTSFETGPNSANSDSSNNLLENCFDLLKMLVPEITDTRGATIVLGEYVQTRERAANDISIVDIGFFYPLREAFRSDPQINALVEAGRAAYYHLMVSGESRHRQESLERLRAQLSKLDPRTAQRVSQTVCNFLLKTNFNSLEPRTIESYRNKPAQIGELLEHFTTTSLPHFAISNPGSEYAKHFESLYENPEERKLYETLIEEAQRRRCSVDADNYEKELDPAQKARRLAVLVLQNREMSWAEHEQLFLTGIAEGLLDEAIPAKTKAWLEAQPEIKQAREIYQENYSPLLSLCHTAGEDDMVGELILQAIKEPYSIERDIKKEQDPQKAAILMSLFCVSLRLKQDQQAIEQGILKTATALIEDEALPARYKSWLEAQPEIQETIRCLGGDFKLLPAEQRVTPYEARVLELAHESAGLLFTRNTCLAEFADFLENLCLNGRRKDFRFGLGSEYGKLGQLVTFVMRRTFLDSVRPLLAMSRSADQKARVRSLFYRDLPQDIPAEEVESTFTDLTPRAQYNRTIKTKKEESHTLIGATVMFEPEEAPTYMGIFPQLEVYNHDIGTDQIKAILIPEHLQTQVEAILASSPNANQVRPLLQIVRSGKTEADFLAGRNEMGRRTRYLRGGFHPNMGYNALRAFENTYMRLVVGKHHPYIHQHEARNVLLAHRHTAWAWGPWLQAEPVNLKPRLQRNHHDWKIFVNPRPEHFLKTLGHVAGVLNNYPEAMPFKFPADLNAEWRAGRTFGFSSDTPKIVIWLNKAALPIILEQLAQAIPDGHGFGDLPGPSFAQPYKIDTLSFKEEYPDDDRVSIGQRAASEARVSAITDPQEIRQRQAAALEAAGYQPPYFHRKIDRPDPVVAS